MPKAIRDWLVARYGPLCQVCAYERYDHIHHIDGDPKNNRVNNLQLLCMHCHINIERMGGKPELIPFTDVLGGGVLSQEEVKKAIMDPKIRSKIINLDVQAVAREFNMELNGL